jgi:hypothetical protein
VYCRGSGSTEDGVTLLCCIKFGLSAVVLTFVVAS